MASNTFPKYGRQSVIVSVAAQIPPATCNIGCKILNYCYFSIDFNIHVYYYLYWYCMVTFE